MEHEFYCRMRRYFRNISYEIWSMEFDYGEGYLAEDKLIVNWCDDMLRVLCLMKSKDRLVSEEYTSIILGIFEDLTDGEGTFRLEKVFDPEVEEYDVQDLVNIHSSIYKPQKEAAGTTSSTDSLLN